MLRWSTMKHACLLILCSACLLACGSDSAENTQSLRDAGLDVNQADATDATAELPPTEEAGTDAQEDAPVEAGPTSCEVPCQEACDSHSAIEGECAACVETVCSDYRARANAAPGRDAFFECMDGCGSDSDCPNECCDSHPLACAWEVAYEMCSCGFLNDSCETECADNDCSASGLTQACGVCASQSPCSLATFDYLFAAERSAHQDCVATCMTSAMSLDECLDLCRDDHPDAAAAYDAYLACVCSE